MIDFVNSLTIIMVVYNKKIDHCDSFKSIINMKAYVDNLDLYVYDNSINPQVVNKYNNIEIEYIHDPKNSGVSKAYNEGALSALKKNKNWVLLLDQDTILPNNSLLKYQKAIFENPEIKLFSPILKLCDGKIFSPCRYLFKRGFHLNTIKPGLHSLNNISPVNSGMLIDLKIFFEVGGYNEKVKLDFGDFQFIQRFRKKFDLVFVVNVIGIQDFSNNESSFNSQLTRFKFYCEGARNIEKDSVLDWIIYNIFIIFRCLNLSIKYKKLSFFNVYCKHFLNIK